MRNGCLPYLGNIYLWKRKSNKEEKKAAKANEVSKAITGKNKDKSYEKRVMVERWMSKDVVGKSHIHDSIAANNNNSLRDSIIVNRKQDSTQDQAKTIQRYKEDEEKLMRGYHLGPCVPKFGDWTSDECFEWTPRRNEFNKVKTFDLRGVKSNVK
ncbi:PREDICTED: uncharacterized protein LOC104737741 [Camelina sativa]|uniref:Uncharacterized protein LOC104737741 n=1 Tax=Camelina sativa TaxID=90675 RepID=A0ABM1QMD5_CAMSA|nr:PREDICTED: uncharacterized protein LOC104737741 [Camelina sativa]XP_019087923.1 PREDICTED: uncharacterized protein LOC104737741 [Camelina sativa]